MASFLTWNKTHYLRVYDPSTPRPDGRQGQLWADAEGIGPDETFEIVRVDDQRFGLKIWGFFVSAQPDGRIEVNRTELRGWELWRLVPGLVGGWAIQSDAWGYVLRAEGGGGQFVNVTDAADAWETFFPLALAGTAPTPGAFTPVRRWGRALGDDLGPIPFIGVSRFYHGHAMTHDRDRVLRDNDSDAMAGYHYKRVMYQVGSLDPGDYWAGVVADQNDPRHAESVRWDLEQCRQRGLRVLATLIGKGNGMDRQRNRREYVARMAHILKDYPDVVITTEIMNEPWMFGEATAEDLQELVGVYRSIHNTDLVATGSYWDAPGVPFIDQWRRTQGPIGLIHLDRDQTRSEMQDRPWRQPWDIGLLNQPWIDNEPIGPGSSVASERRAEVLRSHRLVALISGAVATCFHPDEGIRGFGNAQDVPGYRECPRATRFLSPNVANGEKQNANANFPRRHWDLPNEFLRSGNNNTRGIVRAYGTQVDGAQYTVPFGPVSSFFLIARHDLYVTVYSQVGDGRAGSPMVVRAGNHLSFSGHEPDALIVSTRL